jgi:type IV pilus assembly protein PilW
MRPVRAFRQQGVGLIEVLVAMTIGLVLLGGVGYMFMGSKQMNTTQTDVVRIQESTRNALDVVGGALRQAGYRLNVNWQTFQPAVGGSSGVGDASDVLIVRHDPNWVVDTAVPPNGLLGRETNCEGVEVTSNNAVTPTDTKQLNKAMVMYQFRVEKNQLRCYANDTVPPVGNGVVVADNVERMKVSYGMGDGSESVTSYIALPASDDEFRKVSAVRLSLLLRGPSPGVTVGPQTINFNGANVVTSDGHLRRVVTSTFQLRNQARYQ